MKKSTIFINLLLTLLFVGSFFISRGQQIIGTFPQMDGGFESQAAGTPATASSIATGVQRTDWTVQNTSGTTTISSTGGRSGPKYITYSATAARRLQSPTAANQAVLNATSYTVQFYYKSVAIPSNCQVGNSPDGTSQPGTYAAVSLANTSGVWTKVTQAQTSGSSTNTPRYGISVLRFSGASATGIDVDDYVVYQGAVDNTAPDSPGTVTIANATQTSLDVSWVAPGTGVDGGGYVVVRYAVNPNSTDDPNQNGIYAVGNTFTVINQGTVRYIGTGTSFTDNSLNPGTPYWYKVYTVDKAFNYSAESTGNESTLPAVLPNLTVDPATLNNLNYIVGSGPSASQNYNLSGANLTGYPGIITINGSANYEVSTDNSSFGASKTVSFSSASLPATPIYVRLKAGNPVGNYNGETISNDGGGAPTALVTCNGTVSQVPPVLSVTPGTLSGLTYAEGSGPSASQNYSLSGSNLTPTDGNITLTPPIHYEISLDNFTFSSVPVTVAYTGGTLPGTLVHVRLKAALYSGPYNLETVANAGGGATTQFVTCNGSVTPLVTPLFAWDYSTLPGGAGNFGPSPMAATEANSNVTVYGLTRGSGFGTFTGSGAAKAWGAANYTIGGTLSGEIAANKYWTFTVTANAGYKVSLSEIMAYNVRRSSSGPNTGQWQYQVGSGSFVDIGTPIAWGTNTTAAGNPQAAISLSGITDLQNVGPGIPVTIRLVNYGAGSTTGTCYWNDLGNNTGNDLIVNGTVVAPAIWSGLIDTDWYENGNWVAGIVPASSDNVLIPSGCPNYPILGSVTLTSCHTITISGALTVGPGGKLTVNGDLLITGNLVIQSSGSLITNGSVVGIATIQRTTDLDLKWHFLSSPVTWQNICNGDFAPTLATFPGDISTWDFYNWWAHCPVPPTPAEHWRNLRNSNGNINYNDFSWDPDNDGSPDFEVCKGYLVAYKNPFPMTHSFIGTPNSGDKSASFTDLSDSCTWVLPGNPFPSAVSWTNIRTASGFPQPYYYYVWNDNKAGGAGYEWWGDVSHKSSNAIDGNIPSMQGFFIKIDPAGSKNLVFPNAARLHDTPPDWWLKESPANQLTVRFSNGTNFDEASVMFENNSNAGKDQFDAEKLFSLNTGIPQVYTIVSNDLKACLNSMPYSSDPANIPVGIVAPAEGDYSIRVEGIESFSSLEGLTLEDLKLNYSQNLLQNPLYNFSATGNEDAGRFLLHFSGTIGIDNKDSNPIHIYSSEKTIYITCPNGFRAAQVTVSNMLGQNVASGMLGNQPVNRITVNSLKGYYIVKVQDESTVKTAKIYIQ
jgi:trimeric autotransporter adhesin